MLFLIGYRGSGKTTVAAELAGALGWDWADADELIERRAGKSIRQIFDEDGEPAFRELESAVVAELAQRERTVVALGGGAVMRDENRQAIRGRGKVVWLKAPAELLAERIAGDPTTAARRPALTDQGGLAEIRELLAQRQGVYAACADMAVDVEGRTPAEIARLILASLQ